jgi:hypothetical protein
MRRLLVLLLGLSFAPLLPAEETDLIIPSTTEEMETVLGDEDPCKDCGVVTDVRQTKPKSSLNPSQEQADSLTVVEVTPTGVVSEPLEVYEASVEPWQITIRYDDEFIVHEQNIKPSVEVGDRVQVISGQIVPR